MNGWHFLASDGCLRYGDGRKPSVGETLSCEGDLILCQNGLHASRKAMDALQYANGPIVCYVKLSGEIIDNADNSKVCARERTIIAMADSTRCLLEWTIWCAEQALPLFEAKYPNDTRPRLAIEAKRRWLNGEIAAASWDAAAAAARAAAAAAAASASWNAAAARAAAAAASASWDAAAAAAASASWDSVAASTWVAARAKQNTELERRLFDLLGVCPVAEEAK